MSTNNNITGNYRKVEVIGRGSFGSAILVQSITNRKYYIMKVIDVSKMDRKQKEEAVNEVNVLKSMRHPFIVGYRESFMDKNRYLCIVMDYADGGDMYTKISKQKKLGKGFSESQILDWFVQIALATKYIHDRKVLHRDLKTQNIFLTSKDEIKIGDFGIARVLQDTCDCAQTAIGTPYYVSPEICQVKPYNQKSDIWSLGCILYEMTTLRHAFDATTMNGLLLKILRGRYPPIPPGYSQNLKDLISEMLSKDPNDRPPIKKILEKPFLSGPLTNLINNMANRHSSRDAEGLGGAILDQVRMSKVIDPQSQLSSIINNSQQQSELNDLEGKNSEIEPKNKGLLLQKENNSNARNILPPIDLSNERRNSTGNQKTHEEEKKFDVPIIKKLNLPTNNIQNKKREKESNILAELNVEEINESQEKRENKDNLFNDLNNLLSPIEKKKGQGNTSDDGFEEDPSQRDVSKFLKVEGNDIPGIDTKDSLCYRIETMKSYLEAQLGEDAFYSVYRLLSEQNAEDDYNEEIQKILGPSKSKFLPVVYQLIVCEDDYYGNPNK